MKVDFAITEAAFESAMETLFADPCHQPSDAERGFLAALYEASGVGRRTLILGEIIEPQPGEVHWSETRGLVMTNGYYSRAIDRIQDIPGAGLLNVHSHPKPTGSLHPPVPSKQDLDSDRTELGAVSRALPPRRPVAAAIFSPAGGISVREYTFGRPQTRDQALKFERIRPRIKYVDKVRIVGRRVRFLEANPDRSQPQRPFDVVCTDSSILLWGERGQRLLAEVSIGIAGLGGVGGIVVEHLARLGVGRLLLVDYDRLQLANFNRSQGAMRREATRKELKVKVYSRVARTAATAPGFHVIARRMSVAEPEGISHLLDSDLIVGCADDAFARQVLDHAAFAHLIPVIEGGTVIIPDPDSMRIAAGKCQVAVAGPDFPCLECQGVYTQEDATVARESASWGNYIDLPSTKNAASNEIRAPSIMGTNSLVASLIVLRVLSILLGVTSVGHSALQRYYIETGELHWGAISQCRPGCRKPMIIGRGDTHNLPTGTDLRWETMRASEGRG